LKSVQTLVTDRISSIKHLSDSDKICKQWQDNLSSPQISIGVLRVYLLLD